mmetsp:Transcript_14877/g.29872  ORF Transcript_14877/g.29872 Transcript_14877/m.29872 type:complete len:295 (-) Transcript_14877:2839-3723(-)
MGASPATCSAAAFSALKHTRCSCPSIPRAGSQCTVTPAAGCELSTVAAATAAGVIRSASSIAVSSYGTEPGAKPPSSAEAAPTAITVSHPTYALTFHEGSAGLRRLPRFPVHLTTTSATCTFTHCRSPNHPSGVAKGGPPSCAQREESSRATAHTRKFWPAVSGPGVHSTVRLARLHAEASVETNSGGEPRMSRVVQMPLVMGTHSLAPTVIPRGIPGDARMNTSTVSFELGSWARKVRVLRSPTRKTTSLYAAGLSVVSSTRRSPKGVYSPSGSVTNTGGAAMRISQQCTSEA